MTVEEMLAREAIRQTLATYNISGDRGRFEDMIAQFTQDAILEVPGGGRYEGRDAIKASMMGVQQNATSEKTAGKEAGAEKTAAERPAKPALTFLRHNLTTSLIEFTGPDTATGRTYFIVYTDCGPDHSGYYADTFRKEGDRWLIAHRKARVDWRSPDSRMGGGSR